MVLVLKRVLLKCFLEWLELGSLKEKGFNRPVMVMDAVCHQLVTIDDDESVVFIVNSC